MNKQKEFTIDDKKVKIEYLLTDKNIVDNLKIMIEGNLINNLINNELKTMSHEIDKFILSNNIKEYGGIYFELIKRMEGEKINLSFVLSNYFFELFLELWKTLRKDLKIVHAIKIWDELIKFTIGWEDKNNFKIHKGTPYFFLGTGHLLDFGNLDVGFSCLYSAMEEDKNFSLKVNMPDDHRSKPAYLTLSMIENQANALYDPLIKDLIQAIKADIVNYNKLYSKGLTFQYFYQNFLNNPNLDQEKFFFVYNLHDFLTYKNIFTSHIGKTSFSDYKGLDILFNFCLIIEVVLTYLYGKDKLFKNILEYTKKKFKIEESELLKISDLNRLNHKNPIFIFSDAINKILDDRVYYKNQKVDSSLNLLLLLWILRNYGGHRITIDPIISERYGEILTKILYALFLICEEIN